MDLIATMEEFSKSVTQVKKKLLSHFGDEVFDMDTDDFEMLKELLHVCDAAMDLTYKQASTIHEINYKLDKLLERT